MKKTAAFLMALGLMLPAITFAQDGAQPQPPSRQRPAPQDNNAADQPNRPPNRDGGPAGEPRRPLRPLMAALDANHDGVIDEDEIKNASEALKKLDKNGDGKLTMDELRPPRPDRDGGPAPEDGRPPRRGPRPPEER